MFWEERHKITFGKLSKNLGLRAKSIPSCYNILVHWEGADCKVVNKKSKMVYMYIVKHNFILGGMYYNKAQLHVSAIKVGHLQVVHENLSIGYTNVSGGL
jgi:hypothetical protein